MFGICDLEVESLVRLVVANLFVPNNGMIAVDAVNEGDARPVLRELLRRPEDPANLQLPLLNDPSQVRLKQCEKKENKMNDFGKVVSCNNELNSSLVIGNLGFRSKFRFRYALSFGIGSNYGFGRSLLVFLNRQNVLQ